MNPLSLLKKNFLLTEPTDLIGAFIFKVDYTINAEKALLEYKGINRLGTFSLWSNGGAITAMVMNDVLNDEVDEMVLHDEVQHADEKTISHHFARWMEALKPNSIIQQPVGPWLK